MASNLTFVLEDKPGALAQAAEVLGNAGINIDGIAAVTADAKGIIHILVEDASAAKDALKGAGVEVQGQRDVLVLDVDNEPGVLGKVSRKLGNAGVNIELIYVASDSRIVIAADDLGKAAAAL